MKIIEIRAGERKRILSKFSNSVEMTYQFSAEATGTGNISGIVEVKGSNWLFPKKPVSQELKPDNSVKKGMWDTLYSVYVVPNCDVKITLAGSHVNRAWIYVSIIIAIVAATIGARLLAAG